MLLHRDHGAAGHGNTSTSTGGALPPGTLQIVDAVNTPPNAVLPAGFKTFSQSATGAQNAGFRLAAPGNWTPSVNGNQTRLTNPTGDAFIAIDLTPHTYPDMVQEARYIEGRVGFPNYQRIDLKAVTIRGQPGAVWKFTFEQNGVEQERLDLLFVAQTPAGPQSYALYMSAPKSMFDQLRPTFDEEVETFVPVPR
jgi:hypothetical protein